MTEQLSTFEYLSRVDVADKIRVKQNLKYLPWSAAWAEVKKYDPCATFRIIPQVIDEGGNTRFWHDDGRSGWVEVGVIIKGQEHFEVLSVMDMRNKAIPADQITAVEANKALKRCMVKAIAMHGLGLYIYSGEEVPEETSKIQELQDDIKEILTKKCALSTKAKDRCAELCKDAERKANPGMDEESITGNYKNIDDSDILEVLKKNLMAVRK